MIKAIIFDCFGVLLADSLQVILDELAMTNPRAAREAKDLVRLANTGIVSPEETRPKIAKYLGLTTEQYVTKLRAGEVKNEQLMQYVEALRRDYKTAILSNIGAESLQKRFTADELADHFDVIVASGEIGYAKPEPQAYETTASRLGVRLDECVFTDDREVFCSAATSVGMKAILYTDFVQFTKELDNVLKCENS